MKAGSETATVAASRIFRLKTSDFIQLTKPKLTSLVLFTTFIGFCAGTPGPMPLLLLVHTLIGTALVAGGASAFNMYTEQQTDALMNRTSLRPLTAGRIQSRQALAFAFLISIGGLVYMHTLVNHLTSFVSAIILAFYLFLYTPLKTKTWLCTIIGAVPGALPIAMGWAAAAGSLSSDAWVLFGIVFFWQIPHFYAIGWVYRDDYARAGLPVLSVIDLSGKRTGGQAIAAIVALIFVSLVPYRTGIAGPLYPFGAVAFGGVFLGFGIHFALKRDRISARRLFVVSALYLPALLVLLVFDILMS
jgi:protoheme IX farnesyltransferase